MTNVNIIKLDTPCTAGARSFWCIALIGISSKAWEWSCRPSYVSAYARIRKIEETVIWHPFLPVKTHGHFLHFFQKNSLFFVQKKGPWTGRYCSLKQISEGLFSDPEKSMCQTTGKHVDVSTPYFPLAKMNYFPKDEERTKDEHFRFCTPQSNGASRNKECSPP